MIMHRIIRWLALASILTCIPAGVTSAADMTRIEIEFATGKLGLLAQVPPTGKVVVSGVPLRGKGDPAVFDLHPQRILSDDAQLVIHGAAGAEIIAFPRHRQFAGSIRGEVGSRVIITLLESGEIRGIASSAAEHWLLQDQGSELVLVAVDAAHSPGTANGFTCDGALTVPESAGRGAAPAGGGDASPELQGPVNPAAALRAARVAVETDYEFFQKLGSNVANATAYIHGLLGYASLVYEAEIDTQLLVSSVSLWTDPNDPWTQSNSFCSLLELGKYWNDNHGGIQRTITHMLSGKPTGGGVAWVGVLCNGPFDYSADECSLNPQTSNYGGAYGFVGGISGDFNPGNPGVMWDILATSHEIGHNFNSPHSHCYAGVGGNPNPIDGCYNLESGSSCYRGSLGLPGIGTVIGGPSGQGTGTIMSYCHQRGGGYSNVGMTFGQNHPYGVAAGREAARMREHVTSRAALHPSCFAPPVSYDVLFGDGFEG